MAQRKPADFSEMEKFLFDKACDDGTYAVAWALFHTVHAVNRVSDRIGDLDALVGELNSVAGALSEIASALDRVADSIGNAGASS